ncbi:MAG: hypothetical protein R3C40_10045 [Parvularculaceae bacterium]
MSTQYDGGEFGFEFGTATGRFHARSVGPRELTIYKTIADGHVRGRDAATNGSTLRKS